jgi:hypothetical protein
MKSLINIDLSAENTEGIDKSVHEAHLLNYRIAFDAMRTYHTSEVEHKKDMITILNNVLLSIVTVFAGVFIFILSPEYSAYDQMAFIIIAIIGILYVILIIRLMNVNAKKIKGDNNQYEKFRVECQLERKFLKLDDYYKSEKHGNKIYWNIIEDTEEIAEGDRAGSGHKKTIEIINIYSNALLTIITCLVVISMIMLAK